MQLGSVYNWRAALFMLPILPVLIMLLFQGPADIERLAREGRLPAALEAVQRMDQPRSHSESEMIATLLAASKDPQLTQALFTILNWVEEPSDEPKLPQEPEADESSHFAEPDLLTLQDGFYDCRRSRDGPLMG